MLLLLFVAFCFKIINSLIPCRNFATVATRAALPIPSQCVQYYDFRVSKPYILYACQCLGFLTCSCTDVDARDCTRGLYGHRKRVCIDSSGL